LTWYEDTSGTTDAFAREREADMGLILLIILIVLVLGVVPAWPHSRGWGYWPSGLLGLILLIVIILLITGRLS
jgi:hypothetical protein